MLGDVKRLPEGTEVDGLVLRRWRLDDAADLHAAVVANVEHLRPWMAWIAFEPLTIEDRRDHIERWDGVWADGGEVIYGIWLDGEVVGGCGLHRRLGPGALEIGYWIGERHTRQGFGTAITRALTDLAFTMPDIAQVEVHHDLRNAISGRIPARLGYTRIGEQRVTDRDQAPAECGREAIWRTTRLAWLARPDR